MRPIDADSLLTCVHSLACETNDMKMKTIVENVLHVTVPQIIKDEPTIDAQPVKHGHWILHFDDLFPEESTIECSVCHEHSPADMPHDNFCPNCCAKICGGDADET